MTKKIFGLLLGFVLLFLSGLSFAEAACLNGATDSLTNICVCNNGFKKVEGVCTRCNGDTVCCGVKLNTNIPFIGSCITLSKQDSKADYKTITEDQAFPTLMAGFTKLLMTVILIVCFLVIIVAGVLRTTGDSKKGKDMIKGVAIALALLGASGVILRLVNPNFFG